MNYLAKVSRNLITPSDCMSASLGHVWPKVSDSGQLVTIKEYKRLKKIATEGI